MSELVVYRYRCPYCTNGDMGPDTGRCLHCTGRGLTNDVGGWNEDELVEAPIPPGVMRKPCADCALRPGSPELEDGGKCLPDDSPFWCHHGATTGYSGSHQPLGAWRPKGHPRDIPLGELICAGWWAKASGRPLPTEPYRDLDTPKEQAMTEPSDHCRPVEVDGETIRVRGAGELTDQGRAALAEVVRAGKRRMAEEALTADGSPLRDHIAQALYDADDHIGPWRTVDPDIKDRYRKRAEAVLTVVLPLGKLLGDHLRDTQSVVHDVTALYGRWVKAGAPPLGTSMSRWWDRRLAEMRAALSLSGQPGQELGAPVDWQAIAEQRERELKTAAEARRRAEMAIARVRLIKKAPGRSPFNLAANAQDDGWDQALDAVHAALGGPEPCETGNARKDHPVHELLAALEAGVPHPDPSGLIGRYYQAIHELCCPYDHTERRTGHAAAANRATLDEPKEH